MDDYRRFVLDGGTEAKPKKAAAKPVAPDADARRDQGRRGSLSPLRKRLEQVEARMAKFTELLARVDAVLADPSLFQEQPAKAATLSQQRAELERSLVSAEEEWLQVSAELESASVGA